MRIAAAVLALVAAAIALPAAAQDASCRGCHARLLRKHVVHAAMQMGCATCHEETAGLNAMPHKRTGRKGLAVQPPALCARCHADAPFSGRYVHAPAGGGQCLLCHDPHSSDQHGLLRKPPSLLCVECHGDMDGAHVLAGTSKGHPMGLPETRRTMPVVDDPLRAGRPFSCVSCHEPHRADTPKLTRFADASEACGKCHRP